MVPAASASWMQKTFSSSPESPSKSRRSRAAREANPFDVIRAQSCRSGHFAALRVGKMPSFSQYSTLLKV